MEKADIQGEFINGLFIKLLVFGCPGSETVMCSTSLIYGISKYGTIDAHRLYRPYKIRYTVTHFTKNVKKIIFFLFAVCHGINMFLLVG